MPSPHPTPNTDRQKPAGNSKNIIHLTCSWLGSHKPAPPTLTQFSIDLPHSTSLPSRSPSKAAPTHLIPANIPVRDSNTQKGILSLGRGEDKHTHLAYWESWPPNLLTVQRECHARQCIWSPRSIWLKFWAHLPTNASQGTRQGDHPAVQCYWPPTDRGILWSDCWHCINTCPQWPQTGFLMGQEPNPAQMRIRNRSQMKEQD